MPFEKAIDLVEDLETQHMLQLGLAQMVELGDLVVKEVGIFFCRDATAERKKTG